MLPRRDLDLEATVAVQAAVIAELRAANAALRAQVVALEAANADLARGIAVLEARVAELERRLGQDSSNSSRPPSQDGLRKPTRPPRGDPGGRRPGKQPGAPGAHLAQVAEPDEVVVHAPERCAGCGAGRAAAAVTATRPGRCSTCPSCAYTWSSTGSGGGAAPAARSPPRGSPTRWARRPSTPPGCALGCYLLVYQHLPIDRAAGLLADVLGAPVAAGTLAGLVAKGAAWTGSPPWCASSWPPRRWCTSTRPAHAWRAGCTGSTRPPRPN